MTSGGVPGEDFGMQNSMLTVPGANFGSRVEKIQLTKIYTRGGDQGAHRPGGGGAGGNGGVIVIITTTPQSGGVEGNQAPSTMTVTGGSAGNKGGQVVVQAKFTSIDQDKISSVAGGAQVTMSNGNLAGAVPSTDPIVSQPYMKPCSIPVALNFTAQVITSS